MPELTHQLIKDTLTEHGIIIPNLNDRMALTVAIHGLVITWYRNKINASFLSRVKYLIKGNV